MKQKPGHGVMRDSFGDEEAQFQGEQARLYVIDPSGFDITQDVAAG
jgi:hypothetical protein